MGSEGQTSLPKKVIVSVRGYRFLESDPEASPQLKAMFEGLTGPQELKKEIGR